MKILLSYIGYVLVVGYFLKILFQMYLKNQNGEEIIFKSIALDMEYFRRIKREVPNKLSTIVKFFNLIHFLCPIYIAIIIIFLIVSKI
jgi:hypothetical protein